MEVREIKLPPAVLEAMMKSQMGAERGRRALVTEALRFKQASITVAEGEKQSATYRPKASARRPSCVPKASPWPSNASSKSPEA